jgi:glutathione S-transferase
MVSEKMSVKVSETVPETVSEMLPVLYSFRRCPYAMRARLALQASQLPYEHREVVLKNKPAHLLALSPKGTVPVLWLRSPEGDSVLEQSLDIMLWALKQHDPLGWLPDSPSDLADALAWIELNDCTFKPHLDRYKYPTRFQLTSGDQDREAGSAFLWQINECLQSSPFMNGPRWGFTDAALLPFVRQFAHVDPDWFAAQRWTALATWLDDFKNSPRYEKAMEKMALWQEDKLLLP